MTSAQPSRAVTALWTAAGMAATVYYFSWLLEPGRAGVLLLFVLLVAADLFNGFHAFSFWLTCLRGIRTRPFAMPANARVDVLIPTVNEPLDILEATIGGARRIRGASVRVLVLDDGDRDEIAKLAQHLGVVYVARAHHTGAKSGNLNNVLGRADLAPLFCVFDADHVPAPEFLDRTLGLFVDDNVALVQTPQVYANTSAGPLTAAAAEQQEVFFGPVCAGRDGWRASFCCGTNFVARTDAVRRAGGFPEDSITEDIVLSAEIVGLGYEIAYVGEPLSRGLGPEDARSYVSQQTRWAVGCLELLFRRPRLWSRLSWCQRWQYFVATSYWLVGWTILVYLSLPLFRLVFGWQPVDDSGAFALHFLPYFLVSVINIGRYTGNGYTIRGLAMVWGSFAIHLRATVRVLAGRRTAFAVTSKRALTGFPVRQFLPNLAIATALIAASVVTAAQGLTPETFNNVTFALIDASLVSLIVVFAFQQSRTVATEATPAVADADDTTVLGRASESRHGRRFGHRPRRDVEVPSLDAVN